MPRPSVTARTCAVVLILALGLSSCAGTEDDAATSVALDLAAAVASGNGQDACRLLAPAARTELEDASGKPCDEAVLEERIGTGDAVGVEVFDTMAQVRLDDDTVFLSRFDGAWRVVAAACMPQEPRPYDCGVQVS
jgi:hypothetical protein